MTYLQGVLSRVKARACKFSSLLTFLLLQIAVYLVNIILIFSSLYRSSFTAQPSSSPTEDAYSGGITLQPTTAQVSGRPSSSVKDSTGVPSLHPSECIDDETYRTPFNSNVGCTFFEKAKASCNEWGSLLSETELNDLLEMCPVSCKNPCA